MSVSVTGISWIASDIAPVGHLAVGTLEALPVSADTWVVVATLTRLQHCPVTGAITESLKWAGVSYATIAIDQRRDNVTIPGPAEPPDGVDLKELIEAINLAEHPPGRHLGGLYQWQVQGEVL